GRKSLGTLSEQPESEWEPLQHIRLVHNCFPNLSISGILGDHCLVSQIFPGSTPDTTTTIQMVLAAEKPETPAALEAARNFSELVRQAVEDEDYRLGLDIQAGIGSGANEAFLYGKNEPAVQNYHNWVARFMHQEADVNWAQDSGD
ncbi:MAG: SRPBCC family protein, partial [Pseudomonadales bacterium]